MAYVDVVARRELPLIQLQATAACSELAIRETATASYNAVEVATAEVVARAIAHGVRTADAR